MDVFIGDLHEARAGFVEELAGDEQAFAQVAEVGVNAQFPGVAKGLHLFGFAGEGVVIAVLHGAVVEANLPVRAVFDAVGRVEVDALHQAGHTFAFEERGHHQQAVALDEAVGPAVGVGVVVGDLVEFLVADGVAEEFVGGKEFVLVRRLLDDEAIESLDERFRRDVFVAVEGERMSTANDSSSGCS